MRSCCFIEWTTFLRPSSYCAFLHVSSNATNFSFPSPLFSYFGRDYLSLGLEPDSHEKQKESPLQLAMNWRARVYQCDWEVLLCYSPFHSKGRKEGRNMLKNDVKFEVECFPPTLSPHMTSRFWTWELIVYNFASSEESVAELSPMDGAWRPRISSKGVKEVSKCLQKLHRSDWLCSTSTPDILAGGERALLMWRRLFREVALFC